MKKTISILLALTLLLSALAIPAAASAEDGEGGPVYRDIGHLSEEVQSSIVWLYYNNMMLGTGEGEFSPDANFTRSMFVTVIGRLEDSYKNEPGMAIEFDYDGPTGFSDVPEGRWDSPYIKWAAEKGIVNGVGNGRFNPTGNITTEQFAAIVGRYLEYLGLNLYWTVDGEAYLYPEIYDLNEVSEYAIDYVIDLLGAGVLTYEVDGYGVLVHPQHQLTRAEIAVMLADLYKLLCTQSDYGIEKDTPWGTVECIAR